MPAKITCQLGIRYPQCLGVPPVVQRVDCVSEDVYITGIRDSEAAACLAQTVFEAAQAAVAERGACSLAACETLRDNATNDSVA